MSSLTLIATGSDLTNCQVSCGLGPIDAQGKFHPYQFCVTDEHANCWASNTLYDRSTLGPRLPDTACTVSACTPGQKNSNSGQIEACGGPNANLVYSEQERPTEAAPSAPSTPSTEYVKASNPTWSYQGCYTDSVSARTLIHGLGSQDWTAANCLSLASAAGYKFAGIIYGGECWGSNEIASTGAQQADDKCNWNCASDASTTCGGEAGLDIYLSNTYIEPTPTSTSPSSDSTATGTDSAATETATSGPAEPKKVEDDANYSYLGCYTDSVNARTLTDNLGSEDWTAKNCLSLAAAEGYKYAGIIYSGECWGADEIASTGSVQSASECNWKFANDASTTCGGEKGLDVYELLETSPSTPTDVASSDTPSGSTETGSTAAAPSATASTPSGKVKSAGWSYEGCYTDSVSARTLVNGLGRIIYGGECWGANEIALTGELQAAAECQWRCANNMRGDSSTCGGEHGLDVYRSMTYVEPPSPSTEASTTSTATDSTSTATETETSTTTTETDASSTVTSTSTSSESTSTASAVDESTSTSTSSEVTSTSIDAPSSSTESTSTSTETEATSTPSAETEATSTASTSEATETTSSASSASSDSTSTSTETTSDATSTSTSTVSSATETETSEVSTSTDSSSTVSSTASTATETASSSTSTSSTTPVQAPVKPVIGYHDVFDQDGFYQATDDLYERDRSIAQQMIAIYDDSWKLFVSPISSEKGKVICERHIPTGMFEQGIVDLYKRDREWAEAAVAAGNTLIHLYADKP
ncbi:hypothetical protein JCM8547_003819 [Rhodosporidiobolus lusitaniae]